MSSAFDWDKYKTQTEQSEGTSEGEKSFDWNKYKKETGESNVGSQFGRGFGAGFGGVGGDVVDLINTIKESPIGNLQVPTPKLPNAGKAFNTRELSEEIRQQAGGAEPKDIYERYAKSAGEWSGQEALLGGLVGGVGGPAGAGLGAAAGAAHGAFSGAVYQTGIELGLDEDESAVLAMVATLSPIALKKIAPKVWAKTQKLYKNVTDRFGGGGPPGGPGGVEKGIIGENLAVSPYESAEQALKEAQHAGVTQRPPGPNEPPAPAAIQGGAPPLAGRVSTGPEVLEKPLGSAKLNLPEQTGTSLEGRVTTPKAEPEIPLPVEPEIGTVASQQKFYNEKHGGLTFERGVKKTAKAEREPVSKAYKEAEKVYSGEEDIFPGLAKKADSIIEQYQQSAKNNPGEEAVLKQTQALRELLGPGDDLVAVPINRLIKTADSMSGLANYELPYTGPKGILKKLVKDINKAVEESLVNKGLNASAIRDADKAYSQWANKFLGDEISPFLEKKILNPEALFRKAIKDEGTYRSLKKALGKDFQPSINRLERDIIEDRLSKYSKDLSKVGSKEFQTDIANLEGLLGKERSTAARQQLEASKKRLEARAKQLEQRQQAAERQAERHAAIRPKPMPEAKHAPEGGKKLRPERVTAATQTKRLPYEKQTTAAQDQKIHDIIRKNEYNMTKDIENQFTAQIKKASTYSGKEPEYILQRLNNRSGIKQLRKDLSPEIFDTITKQKMRSILREGNIEHSFSGDSMYQVLNKESNAEIFRELIGEKETNAARDAAKKIGKKQMTQDAIKDLVQKKIILSLLGRDVLIFMKKIQKVI